MNYFTFVKNNWSSLGFPNYKSAISAQKMKDAFRNRNDEPPPEVKKKKEKKHIEPEEVKFKDKRIFVRSLETWFGLKGQRLTNLSNATIDKLYSFIPKYNIDIDKLIDIYNEILTTVIDTYMDDTRPHVRAKVKKWRTQFIQKRTHTLAPKTHINTKQPEPNVNDTTDDDMKQIDALLNQLPGLSKPRRRTRGRRV